MADLMISQLPAVTTPTSTDEFAIADGTIDSKKMTLAQIQGGTVEGAIPFVGQAGVFKQDSPNFFWDDIDNQLGIGTNLPEGPLHIQTGVASVVNPTSQADDLIIQNDGDAGMTIFSPDANFSSIVFGSPGGTGGEGARHRWDPTGNTFTISTTETGADIVLATDFLSEAMRLKASGAVIIGASTPNATAIFEMVSTTKALMPPRWTTAQETTNTSGLGAADKGLLWFNTTSNTLNMWDGIIIVVVA